MAALFSPESERKRASLKEVNGSANNPHFQIPGADPVTGANETKDSLGNPNSPGGYYGQNRKQKGTADPALLASEAAQSETSFTHVPAVENRDSVIRLTAGWDKILFAQRKLCDKAKKIFSKIEAPKRYRRSKRGKGVTLKSQGCIIDLELNYVDPNDEKDAA